MDDQGKNPDWLWGTAGNRRMVLSFITEYIVQLLVVAVIIGVSIWYVFR